VFMQCLRNDGLGPITGKEQHTFSTQMAAKVTPPLREFGEIF